MLKNVLTGITLILIGSTGIKADILPDAFTPVDPTNKEMDEHVIENCENRCNGERTDCWRCYSDRDQGAALSFTL